MNFSNTVVSIPGSYSGPGFVTWFIMAVGILSITAFLFYIVRQEEHVILTQENKEREFFHEILIMLFNHNRE